MDIAFIARIITAFALIAVLLLGLTFVVRALARGRLISATQRKLVTVVESTLLAQNVTLHVVKVADRYYLLAGGAGGMNKIDDVPPAVVEPWLEAQTRGLSDGRDAVVALVKKWRSS